MTELWTVHVTTYEGISPGAIHHYAQLESLTRRLRIEQILDEEAAAAMNDFDDRSAFDRSHMGRRKAGDATNRFDTRADAIAAARAVWEAEKAESDLLIAGDNRINIPWDNDGTAGPLGWTRAVTELHTAAEAIGFWDKGDDKAMRALADRWDALLEAGGISTRSDYDALRASETDAYVRLEAEPERHWVYLRGHDPYEDDGVDYTATLEAP